MDNAIENAMMLVMLNADAALIDSEACDCEASLSPPPRSLIVNKL
jgi:hypothetical protein